MVVDQLNRKIKIVEAYGKSKIKRQIKVKEKWQQRGLLKL